MKHIITVLLLLFALGVVAQDKKKGKAAEAAPDPAKEIKALNDSVANKNKSIKKLEAEIAKLNDNLAKAEGNLKAEKESSSKAQIKALQDSIKNLHNGVINKLEQQHLQDSEDMAKMQKDLDQLETFKPMMIKQMAAGAKTKWLSKPFSALNVKELKAETEQYKKYANEAPEIKDASDELGKLLIGLNAYTNANVTLNSQYDAIKVSKALDEIKAMMLKENDPVRKGELKDLSQQLSTYDIIVKAFQHVITEVDKETASANNHKGALSCARAALDALEEEDGYITLIKTSPWLKEQYEGYIKIMEKDSKGPNAVRDLILSLKTNN